MGADNNSYSGIALCSLSYISIQMKTHNEVLDLSSDGVSQTSFRFHNETIVSLTNVSSTNVHDRF